MINEEEKSIFEKWQKELSVQYPDLDSVYEEGKRTGFIVPIDDSTSVRLSISFDGQLYCQIDMDIFDNQSLPESVKVKTKYLLPRKNSINQIWKYFNRYDYVGVFNCFQDVIKILLQK